VTAGNGARGAVGVRSRAGVAASGERLAIQLQIPVPAEGGQLARRLPAPSRYAYNVSAPTAPGRRQAPASRRDRRDLSAAIVGSTPLLPNAISEDVLQPRVQALVRKARLRCNGLV
jgi:hypothetical protein